VRARTPRGPLLLLLPWSSSLLKRVWGSGRSEGLQGGGMGEGAVGLPSAGLLGKLGGQVTSSMVV